MSVDKDEIRQRKPEEDEDYEPGSDDDEIDSVTQPVTSADKEKKKTSVLTRVVSGFSMLFAFEFIVYLGHYPVLMLIAAIQMGLFYELLNVRYREAVEKNIPHFRTLHWIIFVTAIYIVFGKQSAMGLTHYIPQAIYLVKYHSFIAACLYSALFVVIVLSLKKGYLKYQIGQIAWSMLTIIIVVYQVRAVVPMVMDGLIWFVLAVMTVAWNDTMAYVCGMLFGHKFFKEPLTPLSPNKSWEGYIGGGIMCFIIGQIMCYLLEIPHLYCPFNHPNCPVPSYYTPHFYAFPDWIAHVIGISGVSIKPIYIHEGVLAIFASIVAPFGGFFASAIKRAYGKKDFASVIPGHGGLMDRFDCMFIMIYFTSMYYSTFIKETNVTVQDVMELIAQLTPSDRKALIEGLTNSTTLLYYVCLKETFTKLADQKNMENTMNYLSEILLHSLTDYSLKRNYYCYLVQSFY